MGLRAFIIGMKKSSEKHCSVMRVEQELDDDIRICRIWLKELEE